MSEVTTPTPAAVPSSSPAPSTPAPVPVEAASTPTSKPTETPAPGQDSVAEKKARRLKLKVDGVEEEVDLDAMSDEEATTQLQLARAARKRMQEAADVRKKFEQLVSIGQKDPATAFKALFGKDFRQEVEAYLRKQYEEETLPPEQQEKLKLQRELEELKAEKEKATQAEQARQQEALDQQVFSEMERDFQEALGASDLPKTPETLFEMARVARIALDHGVELSPKQMAAEVRKRMLGTNQAVLRSLKGAALKAYLGEDVVKEIVRMSIEQVRKPKVENAKPFEAPKPEAVFTPDKDDSTDPQKRMKSMREFRKYLKNL